MSQRELDRELVEHLRALAITSSHDGDQASAAWFDEAVAEIDRAIHSRQCSREDILRALRTAYRDPSQPDHWLEIPAARTQPETPRAKRRGWRGWWRW